MGQTSKEADRNKDAKHFLIAGTKSVRRRKCILFKIQACFG